MSTTSLKTRNRVLWTAQILVALLFLFAGSMKFIMPPEKMQQGPLVLPLGLIYFVGVCEILGGLGLVLPGLFRIRTDLTPLAAAGLTIIMIGAATLTTLSMGIAPAIFPAVVGVITASIAYNRRAALRAETPRRVLRAA